MSSRSRCSTLCGFSFKAWNGGRKIPCFMRIDSSVRCCLRSVYRGGGKGPSHSRIARRCDLCASIAHTPSPHRCSHSFSARVPVREPRSSSMVSRSTGACVAVAGAFSTLRAGRNPQILGQCTMISDEQPTLVVTCKLSPAYRPVVVETISDRARIIFLDELEQAAARRAALSSATVLLAHNTAKELRADETSLIG